MKKKCFTIWFSCSIIKNNTTIESMENNCQINSDESNVANPNEKQALNKDLEKLNVKDNNEEEPSDQIQQEKVEERYPEQVEEILSEETQSVSNVTKFLWHLFLETLGSNKVQTIHTNSDETIH